MSVNAESTKKAYVIDTNVLIHDPNSILNFDEHLVVIPITVLEELDKLKNGNKSIAADCRSAIRLIDSVIADSPTERLQHGVPIPRNNGTSHLGKLAILMNKTGEPPEACLPNDNNDNKIINRVVQMQLEHPEYKYVLVTKDINMRLKARGCCIHAEDYHNDQLISDVKQLTTGYHEFSGSFWDGVSHVDTIQRENGTYHSLSRSVFDGPLFINQYILDDLEFLARIEEVTDEHVLIKHIKRESIMHQQAWGLKPRNIYQAMALHALLDNDVHLVNLTGPAGSGKTILALAAAIEMTVAHKQYNKIIVTRSTPPLAEDHGFLPGTEEEKMDPWLGAITDNIEALHIQDESPQGSIEYVKSKANIQFKALNYIRGRSFQRSLILIDESQNLTPHQMKAIITRAGEGSKVICLGNLAQIDTPYLTEGSSGLTYVVDRFKGWANGGHITLARGERSRLADFASDVL